MPSDAEDLNRAVNDLLDRVEFVKVLELLKMNFERGEETVVAEITMKAGYTANDLEFPEILGSLEVLKADGRSRTCLVRYAIRDEFLLEKMREFDLDVIWASPIYKSRDLFIHTCIGDAENLNKILRLMATYGEVRNVIFEEASFSGNDPLSRLTPPAEGPFDRGKTVRLLRVPPQDQQPAACGEGGHQQSHRDRAPAKGRGAAHLHAPCRILTAGVVCPDIP
ncbi:hypothetical protein [Methanoculleus sp.]